MKTTKTIFSVMALICLTQANAQWNWNPTLNYQVVGTGLGPTNQINADISAINSSTRTYGIVWQDSRNSSTDLDIYAQCIDTSAYYRWGYNGIKICNAVKPQKNAKIVGDNTGAFYIAWEDERVGLGKVDIYIQKISAAGIVQWKSNGVAVVSANGNQTGIQMVVLPNGGGVVITWLDRRNGNSDIYAQKFNGSGVAQWSANGVPVTTASGDQINQRIETNGSSFTIVWEDASAKNIFGQILNSNGVRQWSSANGLVICSYSSIKSNPQIVRSGSNYFVSWLDFRTNSEPYYLLMNSSGTPITNTNGIRAYSGTGKATARSLRMISDRYNGVYMAWDDKRNGNYDIYAQRVLNTGVISGSWPAAGSRVCTNTFEQFNPQIAACDNELVITFEDLRRSGTNGIDIYYQKLKYNNGAMKLSAVGMALSTKPKDQSGHKITVMSTMVLAIWNDYAYVSTGVRAIDIYCAPIRITCNTYPTTGSIAQNNETDIESASSNSDTYRIYPNPANSELTIVHPQNTIIHKLKVYNLQGQIVLEMEHYEVGSILDISALAAGLYIIELSHLKSQSFIRLEKL